MTHGNIVQAVAIIPNRSFADSRIRSFANDFRSNLELYAVENVERSTQMSLCNSTG
jgi:hypothetical protein